MIPRSTRLFFFGFFLFSFLSATLPLPADAALVPCGRSSGTAAEQAPCTVCHLIVGGKGVIDYGLQIMTYLAIAVIVAMAIFYIVSSGNEGMMQTAKSGIKAALIGFAVMLSAWLIVNTTLRILSANIAGLTVSSSGFSFTCDTSSSAGSAASNTGSGNAIGGSGGSGNTGGTGGSCPIGYTCENGCSGISGGVCNDGFGICCKPSISGNTGGTGGESPTGKNRN